MIKNILAATVVFGGTAVVSAGPAPLGVDESATVNPETGIRLPEGFKATVFADEVGFVRHIVKADNGWLYGALMRPKNRMGLVAMRDTDGDGDADETLYFGNKLRGTGIGIYDGYLYFGTDVSIMRWKLPEEGGVPTEKPELIAHGFIEKRQHAAKSFALDGKGNLFVNVGAPSNACMEKARTKGSPGMNPCPILEDFGGIWRFSATEQNQHQKDAEKYATGVRNAVALDWNPHADGLYLAQHGRDQLAEFFPEHFTVEESAELPAEEFHRVDKGSDIGWPYSYYDHIQGKRMKMPEYGGDGTTESDIGQMPLAGFPGHWAPNDLLFMTSSKAPEPYKHGAFIAFHGSWNRAPMPQQGYRVAFVPMDVAGKVTGKWVTFADGFAGTQEIRSPRDAKHRPMGLAEDQDGSLYISSLMSGGRVWKVSYEAN
ncbi:PQQ-dependent sugar dehydrogenase [Kordiimonas sp. SCSIO 12603]|uniref:PQQ-dependent sugar dehydrogenase n=1 Tax=Kordiimonas sp. SCSIO 12603 TaxID=2829596 RepID=UPI002103E707|nr:PQQ-dependent sugar dehydrogenase [Kordiimonas sp. SCSIO 12603]UTW58379.1 PQQ-dependent sugar dehydrogenase [Kordiimonas sp. SCSIO 12603]